MAKRKPRDGSFIEIAVSDGSVACARVLPNAQLAVYESRVKPGTKAEPEQFLGTKIAFVTAVMNSAYRSDRWVVSGWAALEPEFESPFFYAMKDKLTGAYSLYRSTDGAIEAASKEQCEALEPAAVWDAEHIDERLKVGEIPARFLLI